jgi:TonB family protein
LASAAKANATLDDNVRALEDRVTQAVRARDPATAAQALAALRQAKPDHARLASLGEQVVQLSRAITTDAAPSKDVPANSAPQVAAHTTSNLKLARARLASGQWLEPDGDSALTYLREARARTEDSSVITILATDLGTRLLDESRAAIAADNAPQARAHFNNAIGLDREFDLALPGLLDVARALDEMTTQEATRSANQIRDLLAPAIKLRESGQLIEPAGNNAFDTIKSIAAEHADASEVRAEQQRLAFTLLDHARTALAGGNLELADALSRRADELVPRMSATQTLRQQISEALAQRVATTSVINAGSLRRTREVPATYPPDAQRRGIQGWVDLEFTVAADGSTRDVVVTAAQPQQAFDKAAVDAMRRWRFEPVMLNGQPIDQRAKLRMQFSLQ